MGKSENGSLIRDLLDHAAPEEPTNPLYQGNDSSVPVMNRDPNNLSWINNPLSDFPKKHTLKSLGVDQFTRHLKILVESNNIACGEFFPKQSRNVM